MRSGDLGGAQIDEPDAARSSSASAWDVKRWPGRSGTPPRGSPPRRWPGSSRPNRRFRGRVWVRRRPSQHEREVQAEDRHGMPVVVRSCSSPGTSSNHLEGGKDTTPQGVGRRRQLCRSFLLTARAYPDTPLGGAAEATPPQRSAKGPSVLRGERTRRAAANLRPRRPPAADPLVPNRCARGARDCCPGPERSPPGCRRCAPATAGR